jgi:hypothetical protein
MKFQQYIIEAKNVTNTDILNIRRKCQPFISWQKSQPEPLPIYRGKSIIGAVTIVTRRKDREPLNTRKIINKEFDNLFNVKFHWKPRAEGVFTCGNQSTAAGYGRPALFFPIGKYTYVWSDQHEDLFLTHNMSDANYKHIWRTGGMGSKEYEWKSDESKQEVIKLLQELVDDCIDTDLDKAIKSKHEIMFNVDKYYLVYEDIGPFEDRSVLENLFVRIIG